MRNPAHLDALIGEALECLNEAARAVRELPVDPVDDNLQKLGAAIIEVWGVRERLYALRPDLKRDFVVESEVNIERYDTLSKDFEAAALAEREGNLEQATVLFRKLLDESKFGFFKLCAEAGLYRLGNDIKP
jgi:hypothetical protein